MIAEVVPESPLEPTDEGLVPAGEGWFVVNAGDARWLRREGRGSCLPLTGWTEEEVGRYFPQVGLNVFVLAPGDTIGMYHRETDQEGFLVVAGEPSSSSRAKSGRCEPGTTCTARPARRTSCSVPATPSCVIVAVGAREHQTGDWGAYTVDETARRHGVGVDEETTDARIAYARFPPARPVRYEEGLLPGL